MRRLSFFALFAVLASLVLLAHAAAPEVFKGETARLKALRKMEREQGMIRLPSPGPDFTKYIMTGPRDYTLIVSLTSGTSKLPCPICKQWQPHFERVAKLHSKLDNKSDRLFFIEVDVAGLPRETLMKLQGSIPGLPFVFKVPSTKSTKERLDIAQRGTYQNIHEDDIAFAVWVNSQTDVHIRIINYQRIIMISAAVAIAAIIAYLKFDAIWRLATNPMLYFTGCVVGYSIVCGGTVFNLIHKPPFVNVDRQGNFNWLIRSPREQLGAEGLVMALIVGSASMGWVALAGIFPSSKKPRVVALLILGATFIAMALARQIFKWKWWSYPY